MKSRSLEQLKRQRSRGRVTPEPDDSLTPLRLGTLLRLSEPSGVIDRAIHKAQIDAIIRLAPGIFCSQLIAGVLLVLTLADSVPVALRRAPGRRPRPFQAGQRHHGSCGRGPVAQERRDPIAGEGGRVGRLGGDEFAVVWTGPSDRASLSGLAERIITGLSERFSIGAASVHVGATIGIAIGGDDGGREEQLMRSADLALYRAKEEGRGGYAFFDHSMFIAAEDLRTIENDVREALDSGELRLVYQPIVDAATGADVGREALLRWRHPTRGDIPPQRFVPIIEDSGLMHHIGDWVIRGACAEAASWQEPLRIAVNVSATQIGGSGLAQTVLGALAATGLRPDRLELEVTESVFLGDDAATLGSLERLRTLGVRLVLDDFGNGYSSFGYLARARFSKIKIDQTFVRGAAQGVRESDAIVHAILALARGLGVETTAEGIETVEQAEAMRTLGCTQLQGFLYGRPMPAEAARPLQGARAAPQRKRA